MLRLRTNIHQHRTLSYFADFDYYQTTFAVRNANGGTDIYIGRVVLNRHKDGRVFFYDVVDIEKKQSASVAYAGEPAPTDLADTNIVPQSADGRKGENTDLQKKFAYARINLRTSANTNILSLPAAIVNGENGQKKHSRRTQYYGAQGSQYAANAISLPNPFADRKGVAAKTFRFANARWRRGGGEFLQNALYEMEGRDEYHDVDSVLSEFDRDRSSGRKSKYWQKIPVEEYQAALRKFMREGEAFSYPESKLRDWLNRMIGNVMDLEAITSLQGHTEHDPSGDVSEHYGEDIDDSYEYLEKRGFDEWAKSRSKVFCNH